MHSKENSPLVFDQFLKLMGEILPSAPVDDADMKLYIIVDPAGKPALKHFMNLSNKPMLGIFPQQYGELLETVEPKLMALDWLDESDITLLRNGYEDQWYLILGSRWPIEKLANHFRQLTVQYLEHHKQTFFFAFYDPKVFEAYMHCINAEQAKVLFNGVEFYFHTSRLKKDRVFFWYWDNSVQKIQISLTSEKPTLPDGYLKPRDSFAQVNYSTPLFSKEQEYAVKNYGSSGVPVEAPRCSVCLMRTFPLRTVDQAESVGTGV